MLFHRLSLIWYCFTSQTMSGIDTATMPGGARDWRFLNRNFDLTCGIISDLQIKRVDFLGTLCQDINRLVRNNSLYLLFVCFPHYFPFVPPFVFISHLLPPFVSPLPIV